MSKKHYGKYEGKQYRGGRAKGRKNLVKTDHGTLVNQHGIEFTLQEKKALESAVNRVNAMRKSMLKKYDKQERYFAGKRMGDTLGNLRLMGKESDVLIQRKTKSLQRFKSKDDFNTYLQSMQGLNRDEYIESRLELYKANEIKALRKTHGADADDIIKHIENMSMKDYRKYIERDEATEISFIYDETQRQGQLDKIRAGFGMPLSDGTKTKKD